MTIDRDIDHLHPSMAARVRHLQKRIDREGLPFRVFETYRTPDRQAQLHTEGNTKAGPFHSAHQFGLSADFAVFNARGDWNWPSMEDPIWDRLHALAYEVNLTAPISWDPGHISWPAWRMLI
jgi:hypothetical protein